MERFLYRLSRSKYKDKVVLKGALMFVVWKAPRSRATRDKACVCALPASSAKPRLRCRSTSASATRSHPNPAKSTTRPFWTCPRLSFAAMTKLGLLNSRMKDFFDIWLLSEQFDFNGKVLGEAIQKTFANRKTELEANPVALSDEFINDAGKIVQWRAFIRRTKIETAPKELEEVVGALRRFLPPIATAILEGKTDGMKWNAPGPWV